MRARPVVEDYVRVRLTALRSTSSRRSAADVDEHVVVAPREDPDGSVEPGEEELRGVAPNRKKK